MARSFAEGCLAEAQGVAARRAEERGSPANLVAALHVAASEVWRAPPS